MTDTEIIQAFLTNNQQGIRWAYDAWQSSFRYSVLSRTHIDEDYIEDTYQEAFIRLQQHILTGRMTEEKLKAPLLAYLKEIGYYVALELIRGRREIPETLLHSSALDNDNENVCDLTDTADEQTRQQLSVGIYDPIESYMVEERERVVREQVMRIGKPCAPLLLGFFWEEKSMDKLAIELGYSNADSAKSQKAKCMKKVMNYVKQNLIALGYGY